MKGVDWDIFQICREITLLELSFIKHSRYWPWSVDGETDFRKYCNSRMLSFHRIRRYCPLLILAVSAPRL